MIQVTEIIERITIGPLRVSVVGITAILVIWAVAYFRRKFGGGR